MHYSIASTDATRWRRLIVAAGAGLLILGALTTYSLLRPSQAADQRRPAAGSKPTISTAEPTESDQPTTGTQIVPGSDPETFARRVAEALFAWDTATITTPTELTERLVAVADPSGESSAGLVADVGNYLPTLDAWGELRRYQTRQWIEITSSEVPNLWPTAVEQAGPDGLMPGTTAYTIHGVRHRFGIWEGEPVSTAHGVAFTVFLVCGPSYSQCHLLRLSRLDEPLD